MGTVFRTVHLALGSQELWATWDPQTLNVQSGAVSSFSPTVAAQFPCSRAPGIGTFSRFSSDSSCHIYPKLLPCVPDSKLPRKSCPPIFIFTGKLFSTRPALPEFRCYHPLDKGYKPSAVSGPHTTPKTEKRIKWAQSPPGLARNWQNPPLHLHEARPPALQGGVGPTLTCPLHVAAGMG